jgi:ATP-dependent DNA helicase RecG
MKLKSAILTAMDRDALKAVVEALEIDFMDDRHGCLFSVTVHRRHYASLEITKASRIRPAKLAWKKGESPLLSLNFQGISSEKIIALLREHPNLSARELAGRIGISPRAVEKQIAVLKEVGRLRRVGPAKGGHWEVIE